MDKISVLFDTTTLLIWTEKNCQLFPPGNLMLFYTLWTLTDYAQTKILFLRVLQPDGTAIIFPKTAQNENRKPLLL